MPRQADPNRLLARLRRLLFLTPLWLATAVVAQGIGWEPSLDYALKAAADKQRVILVAVVMPGERGSALVGAIRSYWNLSRRLPRAMHRFYVRRGRGGSSARPFSTGC